MQRQQQRLQWSSGNWLARRAEVTLAYPEVTLA